jgi:hypothetical protein
MALCDNDLSTKSVFKESLCFSRKDSELFSCESRKQDSYTHDIDLYNQEKNCNEFSLFSSDFLSKACYDTKLDKKPKLA